MRLVLFVVACIVLTSQASADLYSVQKSSSGDFSVVAGSDPSSVVSVYYANEVGSLGWARIVLNSSSSYSHDDQAFGTGFAEGYLTQELAFDYWSNFMVNEYGAHGPSDKLIGFMQAQYAFAQKFAQSGASSSDPFAKAAHIIMTQFAGFAAGYKAAAPSLQALSDFQLYFVAAAGDLENLDTAFPSSEKHVLRQANPLADHRYQDYLMTDCSSLVRILPDLSDVVATHATWRRYYAMLRLWKTINYSFYPTVSIAGSPSLQSSKDDYYTTGNNLVVMETTNNVFDNALYQKLSTSTLLSWQRAMIANYIAVDGASWVSAFSQFASGTYTNQWIVVDMKKFTPRSQPQAGFVWIAEEIPGLVATQDVTPIVVSKQFWPSYNVPFFKQVYDLSGYPSAVAKYGTEFTYENCSRALMFSRDAPKSKSIADVQKIIRYNDFQHDPLSAGNPLLTIASRADLIDSSSKTMKPSAFGAIDAKVTSFTMIDAQRSLVQCGPTTNQQAPFVWSTSSFESVQHVGVPDRFDFPWVTYSDFE
eukprot:ANDGO_02752.mRNA.1 Phospholipase B-like protein G